MPNLKKNSPSVRRSVRRFFEDRGDSQRGQTLLEVTIAGAMLFVVVWGSMALIRVFSHQEHVTSTNNAIRSEEEEIRTEVMTSMKNFVDDAVLGHLGIVGHNHGHGSGTHNGYSIPGCVATIADLTDYVNMDLPSGFSLRLIKPTDTISSLWPAQSYPKAQVATNTPTAAAFNRCTATGPGGGVLGVNQAVFFCLAAFPTAGPNGISHSALASMMPFFGYFSFFNYYTGQKTGAATFNPPKPLSCPDYLTMVHPGGGPVPNPPPPVLSYLYYTLFWKSDQTEGNIFASYSGMMMRGLTP